MCRARKSQSVELYHKKRSLDNIKGRVNTMWNEEAPQYGREAERSVRFEEETHAITTGERETETSEEDINHVDNPHSEQTQGAKKTVRFTIV